MEKQGDKENTAVGLSNLADQQIQIGALAAATDNLHRAIALDRELESQYDEASDRQNYGSLLATCGNWAKSAAELDSALELFTADDNVQGQGIVWAYRTLSALLQEDGAAAQPAAKEAYKIATNRQNAWDRIRAEWLMGWAALAQGNYPESQTRLDEALRRCRAINLVELEPAILLAQARLGRATGQTNRSHAYTQQAITIAQRSGYVLDLADSHNHLAHLALDAGDTTAARSEALAHAQTARDYAFCDGPPYAYQSALDEAERLLAEL